MASIKWASGVSGNWTTKADWTGGVVPGAGDDVTIDAVGKFAVTISTADAAHSLTLNNATATIVDTGTLTLGAALTLTAGVFQLNGGTISGGTLSATGGKFVWNGGTLDGVTYDGTLDMSAKQLNLYVSSNGLISKGVGGSGNGTINFTGYYSNLYFEDTQTIDNVTINMGNSTGYTFFETKNAKASAATLTLGAGVVINQVGTGAEIADRGSGDGTIVNKGVINASAKNGQLSIDPSNFVNQGTIAVSNGDTLNLGINGGSWSNTGAISVTSNGTIAISGVCTGTSLTSLSNNGGSVQIYGTINNNGDTLVVGPGSSLGSATLTSSGTISGGTIADGGSGFVWNGGTLDGVTYDGTLDMSAAGSVLYVTSNGLTAKGAGGVGKGTINDTGASSTLNFKGTQTLDNATINLGNSTNFSSLTYFDPVGFNSGTLTLGVNLTINQTGAKASIVDSHHAYDAITNAGNINATYGGGNLYIWTQTFTNQGNITVANGDTLGIVSYNFFNHGTITATSSTVNLAISCKTSELGGLINNNSTVTIRGALDNTAATLAVGTGTNLGQIIMSGSVVGGTIIDKGSGLVFNGGTLGGVTYDGAIDLSAASSQLTITSAGLVANGVGGSGKGTIVLSGDSSNLVFQDNQTLDNATITLGDNTAHGSTISQRTTGSKAGALTLGVNLTINQMGYALINGGVIVNDGTINATVKNEPFMIDPATFTNQGMITVSNGEVLTIQPTRFTNLLAGTLTGGSFEIDASSKLQLAGNVKVTTDAATIILSGTGSVLQGQVILDSTLATIAATGTLEILGNRNWSSAVAMTNAGTLQLGGGTFAPASLTNTGTVSGFGAITTAITNSGTLSVASGHTLDLSKATLSLLPGASLVIGAGGTLQGPDNSFNGSGTLSLTLVLNGVGSVLQALNTTSSTEVSFETFSTGLTATGVLEILGGRNYTTANAYANAGKLQLGGGTFTSGTLTDAAGSTLTGFGTVASVIAESGVVTSTGGALAFTGTGDQFNTALAGTEIDFVGGTDALNGGSSLTAATVGLSGGAAVTLNAGQSFSGTWSQGASTVNLNGNTLTLSGTAGFNAGAAIAGPGTLALVGDTAGVNENLSLATAFSEDGASSIAIASSDTLTLSGTTTLAGAVTGAGTLAFAGGAQAVGAGATISAAGWSVTGGAVATLNETLAYAGALSEDSASTIALGANTLTLSGAGSALAGTVSGSGALAFNGGAQALNVGAALSVGSWSVAGGAAVSVNENLAFGGSFSEDSASSIAIGSGDSLTLSGPASLAGAITGAGTLALSGSATTTLGGNLTVAATLNQGAGTTLALGPDTLTLTGTGDALAGTVSGTGTLAFSGGSQAINAGASLGVSNWSVSGGAAASVNETLAFAGSLIQDAISSLAIASGDSLTLSGPASLAGAVTGGGTLALAGTATTTLGGNMTIAAVLDQGAGATLALGSNTLTLSGTGDTLAGTVSGTGTLALTGGSDALNAGASFTVSNWSVSGGAAVTLGEALTFGGKLTAASGTTLALGANTLTLTGAGSTLAGSITGTGTLALAGGSQTVGAGASLSVSNWSLSGGAAVGVNENLTYAGAFTQAAATTTIGAGDTMALTGAATFNSGAVVNGAGTLALSNATLAGLTIGGTAILSDTGTIDQTGTVTLGDGGAGAAKLIVGKGATYRIDGNVGIGRGASKASAITVSGTLIKASGTGKSVVTPGVADNGLIEAATGTLDFAGALSGKGALKIDAGATLEAASTAAHTLTATFNGAGGTLALGKASKFAATIAGYTAGDVIDLIKTAATGASVNGSDQLVVVNGASTVATLQLTGNYTAATFTVASDGHGGSNITVTGAARVSPPPSAGQFAQAMSMLGAPAATVHATAVAHPDPWRPVFLAPRMAHWA